MPVSQVKSAEEFKTAISAADPVLVEFFGKNCKVCTDFAPTLEEFSKKYPKLKFYKVAFSKFIF